MIGHDKTLATRVNEVFSSDVIQGIADLGRTGIQLLDEQQIFNNK